MKTLSGIFDYIMRRKLLALGVLIVLGLGLWGIWAISSGSGSFLGKFLGSFLGDQAENVEREEGSGLANAQLGCYSIEISASVGGGMSDGAEAGPGEKISATGSATTATSAPVKSDDSSSKNSVASSLAAEVEVPKTGETNRDLGQEASQGEEAGQQSDAGGVWRLVLSVALGVIIMLGLLKFISDHYLR